MHAVDGAEQMSAFAQYPGVTARQSDSSLCRSPIAYIVVRLKKLCRGEIQEQ